MYLTGGFAGGRKRCVHVHVGKEKQPRHASNKLISPHAMSFFIEEPGVTRKEPVC